MPVPDPKGISKSPFPLEVLNFDFHSMDSKPKSGERSLSRFSDSVVLRMSQCFSVDGVEWSEAYSEVITSSLLPTSAIKKIQLETGRNQSDIHKTSSPSANPVTYFPTNF